MNLDSLLRKCFVAVNCCAINFLMIETIVL